MNVLIICTLLLLLLASGSYCEEEEATAAASPDSADLQAYLDPIMQKELKGLHIPGAVVLVVSNGQIVLAKGYGYANLEAHKRVRPNRTLFRMGSISKLLVATSLMQLVEQGKLHLQDDVNGYLKTFQIDNPFPEPVRVLHLLTHTAGFDERNIESATLRESEVVPLGKYLAKRMPPCVRPPGDLISYSNHGYTLAGYLVELLSGMPYDRYVDDHILKPLGMSRSSLHFREELAPDLATGYLYKDKQYRAAPFDFFNDGPADSLVSSAPDMARFMIANLQQGRYENAQILRPETLAEMQRQHFTHHPGMPGWCYGFWEVHRNNLRGIVHDGGVYGFTARVYLVPEKNFGFLVATNIDPTNEGILAPILTARLLDYYFPAGKPTRPKSTPDFFQRAHLYEGYYRHTTCAVRSLEKIEVLMGFVPEIKVDVNPKNTLTIGNRDFVEIEPFLLQQTTGRSFASFRQNQAGAVTNLFMEQEAFERIRWYDTNRFQLAFGGSCLSLFLIACLVWLVRALRRKHPNPLARLYQLTGITSSAHLIFVTALFFTVARKPLFELSYGLPMTFKIALVLPLLALILTPFLLISLFRSWKHQTGALIERIYFSLMATAAAGFVWFLNYWNLIGYRY